jgi:chromosome segregation ATPase
MKRAFENNLPRVKPRVRFGAEMTEVSQPLEMSELREFADRSAEAPREGVVTSSVDAQRLAQQVLHTPLSSGDTEEGPDLVEAAEPPQRRTEARRTEARTEPPARVTPNEAAQRREKLRSRLRSLANGGALRSGGSPDAVIAAAEDLVQQLESSRAVNARLEAELKGARRDMERAATDAEQGRREGESLQREVVEARELLGSLEAELAAVEAERDEVLYEVRRLREAESTRSDSLTSLSRELDESRRELAEKQAEQAEILNELRQSDADRAKLRLEVSRLEQERARTLQELEATALAEGELREQRGTLSRVHQVLAAARKS